MKAKLFFILTGILMAPFLLKTEAQTPEEAIQRFLKEVPQISIFTHTTDPQGNIYIAGVFADSVVLSNHIYRSRGMLDIFIARLNPAGEVMWFKHAGGSSLDYFKYIETDKEANVYVSALFRGRLVFEDTAIFSDGISRHFTIKYTPDGEMLWIRKNTVYR
ncbi:MAG TPA: hypothetical protein PLC81_03390 [Bacteroidales bacterium]|nr:hypothetical protein [Bacteroidales bacterium]